MNYVMKTRVLREIWNNSLELSLFHFYLLVEYL